LLALIVLVGLVLAGLYYWRGGDLGTRAATSRGLDDVGDRIGQVGQTVGGSLRDTKLTGQVRAALEINRALEPFDFDVATQDGVVVLSGEVPTEELRRAAQQVAAGVPDVREVKNEIRVAGVPAQGDPSAARRSVGENIDDRALEAKVRMAYSLNRGMAGSYVMVNAFKREVTLSGTVTGEAQRQLAVAIARDTAGVAGVRDQIAGGAGATAAPGAALSDRARAAQAALAANPSLAGYGLTVREEGGRLLLAGRVKTTAERDLAALMARDAAGMAVESSVTIQH
jgi:osmotically-inducible protein OsmY